MRGRYHENIEVLITKLNAVLPNSTLEHFLSRTRCDIIEFKCMGSSCKVCARKISLTKHSMQKKLLKTFIMYSRNSLTHTLNKSPNNQPFNIA